MKENKAARVEEGTVTASIVGQLPDSQGEPPWMWVLGLFL